MIHGRGIVEHLTALRRPIASILLLQFYQVSYAEFVIVSSRTVLKWTLVQQKLNFNIGDVHVCAFVF